MDNKALADFVKAEVSKVTAAINKLILKLSAPREQDETSIAPHDNPSNEANSTPGEPLIIPPTPANARHSKGAADDRHPRRTTKRRISRQFKRIFLKKDRLERGAFIAGIAYAIVTILQWRAMEHSNTLNRTATELSNRAYIAVSRVEIFFDDPTNILLKAIIQNTGRVPSAGLTVGWQFVTQPRVANANQFYVDRGNRQTSTVTAENAFGGSETIVPPGASDYFVLIQIPESVVAKIKGVPVGGTNVMLAGEVYYGTGFGGIDNADFCFNLQPLPKATWVPCQFGPPGGLDTYGMKNRYNAEKEKTSRGK
jgi:hypothetical protein